MNYLQHIRHIPDIGTEDPNANGAIRIIQEVHERMMYSKPVSNCQNFEVERDSRQCTIVDGCVLIQEVPVQYQWLM